jgi:polysaccharide transporter, PST family
MPELTASRGARGGAITVAGQLAKMLIQFIGLIVLSRLLSPEDFGLIAMVTVFVTLGEVLRDFGMPTAALQARTLTQAQASNLFWINSGLGLVVATLMVLATPLVVAFYDEPRLGQIVPVAALTLLLGSVSAQFQVHLARAMRFLISTATDVAAQVIGLVVAVVAALLGAGYWALSWQYLAIAAALLVSRALVARWVPNWPRRRTGTRSLSASGTNFGFAYLLTYLANNVDTLVVGARYDAPSVGYYNRSFQLLTVPVRSLLSPLTNVVVPTVNRLRDEGRSIDASLLRIQSVIGIAIVWLFAVTAASAEYLVPLVLGDQWNRSILIFQILAAGGVVWTFSNVSFWGFILYDRSRQLLFYNLFTKTIAVLLVFAGAVVSLEGTALGYSLGLIISWPINLIWLSRTAGQRSLPYFWNGMRLICAGALAFVASRPLISLLEPIGVASATAVIVLVSTVIFLGALTVLPGGRRELRAGLSLVRNLLPSRAR